MVSPPAYSPEPSSRRTDGRRTLVTAARRARPGSDFVVCRVPPPVDGGWRVPCLRSVRGPCGAPRYRSLAGCRVAGWQPADLQHRAPSENGCTVAVPAPLPRRRDCFQARSERSRHPAWPCGGGPYPIGRSSGALLLRRLSDEVRAYLPEIRFHPTSYHRQSPKLKSHQATRRGLLMTGRRGIRRIVTLGVARKHHPESAPPHEACDNPPRPDRRPPWRGTVAGARSVSLCPGSAQATTAPVKRVRSEPSGVDKNGVGSGRTKARLCPARFRIQIRR